MNQQADVALIAACQQGDSRAFRKVFDLYRDRIHALCRYMSGNAEDAEDLTQEVFVSAFRNIGTYRADAAFGTWLYRIAANRCTAELRKRTPMFRPLEAVNESDRATTAPNPEDLLVRKELADRVETALAALPESQRLLFVLGTLDGMRYGEIAGIVGCSEDAVKQRIHHPNRVSRDQIRTIENLHSNMARLMAASFSTLQRAVVDTDIAFVDQTSYAEFIMSLSNPSCSYVFTIQPLGGPAIIDFSLPVAYGLIDRQFGGKGGSLHGEKRSLTAIERGVMAKAVRLFLADFEATWEALLKLRVSDAELETNPEFMQVAAPSDTVILIAFEVNSQHASGLVNLCYPFFTLEPVMSLLNVQSWGNREKARSVGERQRRLDQLRGIDAELSVTLGRGTASAEDIAGLKVGDTIILDTRTDDPGVLFVEKEPLFLAKPGVSSRGRHAAELLRAIPQTEARRYV